MLPVTNVRVDNVIDFQSQIITADANCPVPHRDFVDLIDLCIRYNCIGFELLTGSPHSTFLVNVYVEDLENSHMLARILSSTKWFRYLNDILITVPSNLDLHNILGSINNLEPTIKFAI